MVALSLVAGATLIAVGATQLVRSATGSAAGARTRHLIGAQAALGRLYSPASPFNRPIPADARVDPQSDLLVHSLVEAAAQNGAVIAVGRWTVPVYLATSRTPRVRVSLTASWAPARAFDGVPMPAAARPDPAGDGHLAVIDRRSSCEYDFWKAEKRGRTWSAAWGNSVRSSGTGVYPRGLSARGSGFALLAGLIWPDELARGRIDHALIFSYPHTSAAGFVPPATESDGRSQRVDAIPEGARLQLDPTLDVDSLMLPRHERTIARALQRYGMYLADTGGNVSLYAVNPQSYGGRPYAGLLPDVPYTPLRGIPFSRFRVLEHAPPERGGSSAVPSGCGRLR
jgi:hypothetical protein